MATYNCTSNTDLESFISANSMVNQDNINVESGAVLTVNQTPSILLGAINVNNGEFFIDGENIAANNVIHVIGERSHDFTVRRAGSFKVRGDWFNVGTTDGSDSQAVDCSAVWSGTMKSSIPAIWVETGRRINFDNSTGEPPSIGAHVYKESDNTQRGRIVEVGSDYLIVQYFTGVLSDNDLIECLHVIDDEGPFLATWQATVNNASGDVKESGIYMEFCNTRDNGVSYINSMPLRIGGFAFDHVHGSDTITLGHSTNGGWVPPTGCNIRIPNVIVSTTTPAGYAANNILATSDETEEWDLDTSLGGAIDMRVALMTNVSWLASANRKWDTRFCGFEFQVGSYNSAFGSIMENCVIAPDPITNKKFNSVSRVIMTNSLPGIRNYITDCLWTRTRADYGCLSLGAEHTIKGCVLQLLLDGAGFTFSDGSIVTGSTDGTIIEDCVVICEEGVSSWTITSLGDTTNIQIKNLHYSMNFDYSAGPVTTSATLIASGTGSGPTNALIQNIQLIGQGFSDGSIVEARNSTNVKFRAIGTKEKPFNIGTSAPLYGAVMTATGSSPQTLRNTDIARCHFTGGKNKWVDGYGPWETIKNVNSSWGYDTEFTISGPNCFNRGVEMMSIAGSGPGNANQSVSGYSGLTTGIQVHDIFVSDSYGQIYTVMIPPNAENDYTSIIAGTPYFYGDGSIRMASGDIIEIECPYVIMGHASFTGNYTAYSTTSSWGADEWTNCDIYMQYDNLDGSGWNGVWLDIRTPANLTGITGMVDGFRIKFRLEASGDCADYDGFLLETNSSPSDRISNLIPIDQEQYTLTIKDIPAGAEWRLYNATGAGPTEMGVEIMGQESKTGDAKTYTYTYASDFSVTLQVIADGYEELVLNRTLSNSDLTIFADMVTEKNT